MLQNNTLKSSLAHFAFQTTNPAGRKSCQENKMLKSINQKRYDVQILSFAQR